MDGSNLIYILLLVLCLLFSAFFSSAETAFLSLQRFRLRHLAEKGVEEAAHIEKLLREPERLLAAVLLGNNLVNTAAAVLGTLLFVSLFQERGALIATFVVTGLLLLFGEIIPKTAATRAGEKLALLYTKPLQIFTFCFFPVVRGLAFLSAKLARYAGRTPIHYAPVTEEEICALITMGREEGGVEAEEAEIAKRVFSFGDRKVGEIITPRTEIAWIEEGTTFNEFLKTFAQAPHSRFPVYRETVDNVVGVLWIKDVLMAQARGELGEDEPVTKLARPPYFVPESKPVGELFAEMRERHIPLALVVDEYGGTVGLVTMEQLVEEIVGEIGDELSRTQKRVQSIDLYTFEIDAGLRIEEVNEKLGLQLPKEDYETIAGFILSVLGRIPKEGEQFRYDNITFVITEVRGVKIERVRIIKPPS